MPSESLPSCKTCTRCNQSKPLVEFLADRRYLYGVTSWCKACKRDFKKEFGQRNAWKNRTFGKGTAPKTCAKCKNEKPASEFTSSPSSKDGLNSRCKECRRTSEYAKLKPEGKLRRRLWNLYKMTVEEYEQMLSNQEGKCAVCFSEFCDRSKPNIDHDPEIGKVRGIVCSYCNTRIGVIENTEFVALANRYLSKFINT